jgi:hypothetical protein
MLNKHKKVQALLILALFLFSGMFAVISLSPTTNAIGAITWWSCGLSGVTYDVPPIHHTCGSDGNSPAGRSGVLTDDTYIFTQVINIGGREAGPGGYCPCTSYNGTTLLAIFNIFPFSVIDSLTDNAGLVWHSIAQSQSYGQVGENKNNFTVSEFYAYIPPNADILNNDNFTITITGTVTQVYLQLYFSAASTGQLGQLTYADYEQIGNGISASLGAEATYTVSGMTWPSDDILAIATTGTSNSSVLYIAASQDLTSPTHMRNTNSYASLNGAEGSTPQSILDTWSNQTATNTDTMEAYASPNDAGMALMATIFSLWSQLPIIPLTITANLCTNSNGNSPPADVGGESCYILTPTIISNNSMQIATSNPANHFCNPLCSGTASPPYQNGVQFNTTYSGTYSNLESVCAGIHNCDTEYNYSLATSNGYNCLPMSSSDCSNHQGGTFNCQYFNCLNWETPIPSTYSNESGWTFYSITIYGYNSSSDTYDIPLASLDPFYIDWSIPAPACTTLTNQSGTIYTLVNYWPLILFPLFLGGLFGLIGVFIGFIIGVTLGVVIGVIPLWVNIALILVLTFTIIRREF